MPEVPTDDPYSSELRNIILPDAEKQPDRSLAIVFVAIVEDHLTQAIKAHLIDHKKICDGMFNGMGPLATFSAKIDLGILLGLYGADLTKALHALRRIRNTFAHDIAAMVQPDRELLLLGAGEHE